MDHGLGLVGLSASPHPSHPATEHHVEHVHRGAEPATPSSPPASSLLDSLLPSLVIDLPLLSVGQDLVGLKYGNMETSTPEHAGQTGCGTHVGDFFELISGVRIFVRMILHC